MEQILHTVVFAQIMGLYMVIMAIILLGRVRFFRDLLQSMSVQGGELMIAASFGLMLGVTLVVMHNIWVWHALVLVTIVSWYILIKSILWLAFPQHLIALTKKITAGNGYYLMVIIMGIVGILLLTVGFHPYF